MLTHLGQTSPFLLGMLCISFTFTLIALILYQLHQLYRCCTVLYTLANLSLNTEIDAFTLIDFLCIASVK